MTYVAIGRMRPGFLGPTAVAPAALPADDEVETTTTQGGNAMTGLRAMALIGGDVASGFVPPQRPSRSGRRHAGAAWAWALVGAVRRGLQGIRDSSDVPVFPGLRSYPY